jgi:hypothetical protein
VGGDIGNVEPGQHLLGGAAVVIGRPPTSEKPVSDTHGVHIRAPSAMKKRSMAGRWSRPEAKAG